MKRVLGIFLLFSLVACDGSGSSEPDALRWDGTYRGDATVYRFDGAETDTLSGSVVLDVALADAEALDSVVVDVEYGSRGTTEGSLTQVYRRATTLTPTRIDTREVVSVFGAITIQGRTRLQRSGGAVDGETVVTYTDDEREVWPDSVRLEFARAR